MERDVKRTVEGGRDRKSYLHVLKSDLAGGLPAVLCDRQGIEEIK